MDENDNALLIESIKNHADMHVVQYKQWVQNLLNENSFMQRLRNMPKIRWSRMKDDVQCVHQKLFVAFEIILGSSVYY